MSYVMAGSVPGDSKRPSYGGPVSAAQIFGIEGKKSQRDRNNHRMDRGYSKQSDQQILQTKDHDRDSDR